MLGTAVASEVGGVAALVDERAAAVVAELAVLGVVGATTLATSALLRLIRRNPPPKSPAARRAEAPMTIGVRERVAEVAGMGSSGGATVDGDSEGATWAVGAGGGGGGSRSVIATQ
jgi:hypothetical protein